MVDILPLQLPPILDVIINFRNSCVMPNIQFHKCVPRGWKGVSNDRFKHSASYCKFAFLYKIQLDLCTDIGQMSIQYAATFVHKAQRNFLNVVLHCV